MLSGFSGAAISSSGAAFTAAAPCGTGSQEWLLFFLCEPQRRARRRRHSRSLGKNDTLADSNLPVTHHPPLLAFVEAQEARLPGSCLQLASGRPRLSRDVDVADAAKGLEPGEVRLAAVELLERGGPRTAHQQRITAVVDVARRIGPISGRQPGLLHHRTHTRPQSAPNRLTRPLLLGKVGQRHLVLYAVGPQPVLELVVCILAAAIGAEDLDWPSRLPFRLPQLLLHKCWYVGLVLNKAQESVAGVQVNHQVGVALAVDPSGQLAAEIRHHNVRRTVT